MSKKGEVKAQYIFYIIGIIFLFATVAYFSYEYLFNLSNIIKATIYLSDMNNYAKMNEIYGKHFIKDYPTRAAVAVKELPRKALIEIECTASGDKVK